MTQGERFIQPLLVAPAARRSGMLEQHYDYRMSIP